MFQPGFVHDDLTRQLNFCGNPVRAFLEKRFGGQPMFEMERDAPAFTRRLELLVPPGDSEERLVRDAAECMLRALVGLPDLFPARDGAGDYRVAGVQVPDGVVDALGELAAPDARPITLGRACWALALLAAGRGLKRPDLRRGPIGSLGPVVSRDDLMRLAPEDAVVQLAMFHHVFATRVVPRHYAGQRVEPTPGVSRLAGAKYVDTRPVLSGGRLLEVATSAKWLPFRRFEAYRLIAGALLDFEDELHIRAVGVLHARYGDVQWWGLVQLLDRLAGGPVSLPGLRDQFRQTLATSR